MEKDDGGKQPNVIVWEKTGEITPCRRLDFAAMANLFMLFYSSAFMKPLFPKTLIGLKLRQNRQSSFRKCHLRASSVFVRILYWRTFESPLYSQKGIIVLRDRIEGFATKGHFLPLTAEKIM